MCVCLGVGVGVCLGVGVCGCKHIGIFLKLLPGSWLLVCYISGNIIVLK